IPKIRRPRAKHTTDQIVAQARQLGWTVGITMQDLVGAQCGAVIGLHPQDEEWLSGKRMAGVWFKTQEDASLHQHAMDCVPYGRYQAMAVAPLASNRLNPPDICLLYGPPGQMIFMINGLQWSGYKKLVFTGVGESACADSWGKALKTDEPALTIPCYAERRYGGGADDEMLMALPPRYLPKMIDGLAALFQNGLRYPVPPYGIQGDAAARVAVSYSDKDKKAERAVRRAFQDSVERLHCPSRGPVSHIHQGGTGAWEHSISRGGWQWSRGETAASDSAWRAGSPRRGRRWWWPLAIARRARRRWPSYVTWGRRRRPSRGMWTTRPRWRPSSRLP